VNADIHRRFIRNRRKSPRSIIFEDTHDREQALGLIDPAVGQVREGIAFAATH